MNVAITATEPSLQAKVDPRFGRCPCFLIVDTDTLKFEVVENPNLTLGSGAGIQSAQLMAGKGVKFILTGNCGPNAYQTLTGRRYLRREFPEASPYARGPTISVPPQECQALEIR